MTMMDTRIALDRPPGWAERHSRVLIAVLGATMLLAAITIYLLDYLGCQTGGDCGTLARLDAAWDAETFEHAVWQASSHPSGDAPTLLPGQPAAAVVSIKPLRAMLFVDSLVLVPSYTGLLLVYIVVFHHLGFPPRRWHYEGGEKIEGREWWLQLACLLVVIAGVFDIAENGMTMRAAEDALERLLADPTVADVHLATSLKWAFIALAIIVAGTLALKTSGRPELQGQRLWLRCGCAFAGCAGVCLSYRATNPSRIVTAIGLALFVLALVVLGVALWRIAASWQTPRSASLPSSAGPNGG
jgi:hypothetical protein